MHTLSLFRVRHMLIEPGPQKGRSHHPLEENAAYSWCVLPRKGMAGPACFKDLHDERPYKERGREHRHYDKEMHSQCYGKAEVQEVIFFYSQPIFLIKVHEWSGS
jgi:hypothetical protein